MMFPASAREDVAKAVISLCRATGGDDDYIQAEAARRELAWASSGRWRCTEMGFAIDSSATSPSRRSPRRNADGIMRPRHPA